MIECCMSNMFLLHPLLLLHIAFTTWQGFHTEE